MQSVKLMRGYNYEMIFTVLAIIIIIHPGSKGDFNVILSEEEKIGVLSLYPNKYEDFAFCVNSCDLVYVSFKWNPFTWWNGGD